MSDQNNMKGVKNKLQKILSYFFLTKITFLNQIYFSIREKKREISKSQK